MHHGLAQVFGPGFAASMALRDDASFAVILHNGRVGDGYIGCSLLEVCHGITPCGHHAVNERAGFADSYRRIVNETLLNLRPFVLKTIARGLGERFD